MSGGAAHHLRRALVRAALVGGLFVGAVSVLALVLTLHDRHVRLVDTLLAAAGALILGLGAAPAVLVESLAANRPPSLRRDAITFIASWLATALALIAVAAQIAYAVGVYGSGDVEHGLRAVIDFFHDFLPFDRRPFLPTLLLLAAPAPFVAVARVRGSSWRRQIVASVLGGLLLGAPSIVAYLDHVNGAFAVAFVPVCCGVFALCPLALAAADRIEARIARRLFEIDAPATSDADL